MKQIFIFLVILFSLTPTVYSQNAPLKLGAERMDVVTRLLKDKRVGLVVNQTSILEKRQIHLLDALVAEGIDVKKVFAPEHGFRGTGDAGEEIKDSRDLKTGIPIISIYGKNKKAFNLDMDNTLWGGIVGDDGADNIEIGQETSLAQTYSEFQEYLKMHKQLGVLLTVNSKNDKENALAGLNRPDSILKPDDFVTIKANWNPKSQNLIETANEMALLPESYVFVDDNPAERAIVESQIPGVAIPEIEGVEHYIQTIDKSGFFEVTSISSDDLKRAEMYKENAKRSQLQATFVNYEDFLKSLEMKGEIHTFVPAYMSRIAQLTNKSNQFNLTTRRYTQDEIEAVADDADHITLYGKLADKFGDNGVVSIVIGRIGGDNRDELHMELWLMSCRVLKRDMEFAMMDELVEKAKKAGVKKIIGYYYPTAKNAMVKDFYGRMGFEKKSEDAEGNSTWEFMVMDNYKNQQHVIEVTHEE